MKPGISLLRALVKNDSNTDLKNRPFSAMPDIARKSVGFEEVDLKENSIIKIDDDYEGTEGDELPLRAYGADEARRQPNILLNRKIRPQTAKVVFKNSPSVDQSQLNLIGSYNSNMMAAQAPQATPPLGRSAYNSQAKSRQARMEVPLLSGSSVEYLQRNNELNRNSQQDFAFMFDKYFRHNMKS